MKFSYPSIFTLALLLFSSACDNGEGSLPKPSNPVDPQTLNVTPTVSSASAQAEIDPSGGGSIELTDGKGVFYRLNIPSFALPGEQPLTITLTAIEEMSISQQGLSFLGGVRIEPAIKLLDPASLAIKVTSAVENEVIGFRQTGSQRFFVPIATSSSTEGFLNLLEFGDVSGLEFLPGTGCNEKALTSIYLARQELACLKAILSDDFFDDDVLLENFANRWADFTFTTLQSAANVSDIFAAVSYYNLWYFEASFVDPAKVADKTEAIHDLAAEKIEQARNTLNSQCLSNNTETVQYQFQQLRKIAGRTNSTEFPIFDLVDLETANFCQ